MTATLPNQAKQTEVAQLLFDSRNPRLHTEGDEELSQQQIFDLLWADFAVDEVAASIAANGYFAYEPLMAVREDDALVVLEGNRRLAALKALLGLMRLSNGKSGLPAMSDSQRDGLREVPCVLTDRQQVWQYIGFKHVNGPQAWQSASKASYIADVHNKFGVPLEDIARQIGDRHSTVQRLYRALMVIDQAERADVFQRADRFKQHFSFSHLYTGLDYAGIQSFLEIENTADDSPDPVPNGRLTELGELCLWLYGSKSRNRPPLVNSQNPDLRVLDDVLRSANGVAALRRGLPLQISQDISKGDALLLREALVSAKQSLSTARGHAITGFDQANADDLLQLAEDVTTLGDAIYEELFTLKNRQRRERRVRHDDTSESDGDA